MSDYIFIVGSPRSGTTLTGKILESYPKATTWYVPYFIWERYFKSRPNDKLTASDAEPKIKNYIRGSFSYFKRKTGANYVIDQSPRNSLRIPFMQTIFPETKFIHVLRDGRDAVLSINKEWERRRQLAQELSLRESYRSLKEVIGMQPIIKHKLEALLFELSLSDSERVYHRQRWQGEVGWGPRFPGWEEKLQELTTLEFNAWQWKECVEAIREQQGNIYQLKYENLLQRPKKALKELFSFLDLADKPVYEEIPSLKRTNYGKWHQGFTDEEKSQIGPIINPLLKHLGYADSDNWY